MFVVDSQTGWIGELNVGRKNFKASSDLLSCHIPPLACWKLASAALCCSSPNMPVSYYDEIELEDMSYDEEKDLFHYPCPCGDRFEITRLQLKEAEDVARCPSCSLLIRVVFDPIDFEDDDDQPSKPAEVAMSNPVVSAAA